MPETTIPTDTDARAEAAKSLDDARGLLRSALTTLSDAGMHHAAEHLTVAIDSVDGLRSMLVESAAIGETV